MFVKNVKINLKKFRPAEIFTTGKPEIKSENENVKTKKGPPVSNLTKSGFISHRYGEEYRFSASLTNDIPKKSKDRIPLAFCTNCDCDRPMKWKPMELRGKTVESWFVCNICGCDRMTIKKISHTETIKINMKENKKREREKYE